MKTLLLFLSLINFWFDIKTHDKINYLQVNYSKHFSEPSFSLSEWFCYTSPKIGANPTVKAQNLGPIKSDILLPQKDGYLKGGYLAFVLGIAITAIGLEFLLNKKANAIKQHNDSLLIHHQTMLKRNSALNAKVKTLTKSAENNKKVIQAMAHDLRSPVAAIVGLSSFIIEEQKLPPEDLQVIDLIHTSGQDSLHFINEILSRETQVMHSNKLSIKQLLTYCIAQLQVTADEKQQKIVLRGADFYLHLDRAKIWRALSNLIGNAIKFSPPYRNISVDITRISQYIQIAIADEGIGIPAELKDKIFNQNDNIGRQGTFGEQSFGMGLAIAKKYIEMHGGLLTFESEEGKGTTFFVNFPIK